MGHCTVTWRDGHVWEKLCWRVERICWIVSHGWGIISRKACSRLWLTLRRMLIDSCQAKAALQTSSVFCCPRPVSLQLSEAFPPVVGVNMIRRGMKLRGRGVTTMGRDWWNMVGRYFMAGRCSLVGEVMGRFFTGLFSYVLRELVSIFLNCVDRRRMTLLRDCIFSCVWGVGVCSS